MRPFFFAAGLLAAAVTARNPQSLAVVSGDYPRAFFFRTAEGTASNPATAYDRWDKAFSRLGGIEGKTLDEEIPNRSARNIDFFTRFKKQHPDQLVLLHYNGNARDPRDTKGRYFAGHWLYFNGARIVKDIPAAAGQTTISVSDPSLFLTGVGRYHNANEDIGLCELDSNGRPDWNRSEQVKLISVDKAAKTIRVERGQFGTQPRGFAAGKAYAAAHAFEGPWGEKSNLLWFYNHSLDCPRDPQGRSGDDVLVTELGEHFNSGGDLAALDGLEFDVLRHSLRGGNPARPGARGIDTDSDGIPDDGIFNGVNRYGLGSIEFCKRLRARLGEKTLIMADGWSVNNQRAFGILNGIEAEGWPTLRDYKVDDWSGGLNRQLFWVANSRPPVFNYINHKFNIDGEVPGSNSPAVPQSINRLVFAGAVFTDSAICYSLKPPSAAGEMIGIFDELRSPFLGKPLGPAVHLAESHPPVRVQYNDGKFTGLPTGKDIVLRFTAKAPGAAARMFRIGDSYGWANDRDFRFIHYSTGLKSAELELSFEPGDPVTIRNPVAYAYPDLMYRQFERGVVLANPSNQAQTFDMAKLFPGKRYKRLKGSPDQDPKTNDGSGIGPTVEIPAKDALFLILR